MKDYFTRPPNQPLWLICIAIIVLCYYWVVQKVYQLKDRIGDKE